MPNDNELKPPEGWLSEGVNSSTEIREPSDSNGPDAENSDWVRESKPKQRNPASDFLTGAALGVGSKVVNPITEKVLGAVANKLIGPEIAGAKSSIYHPQPSTPVTKWTSAMHTGDISAAKDARHFKEANQKMMEFYEAQKKAEALRKAEALFQTEEQIRKSATPVTNVIRTASEVMSPTGESLLGKAAGFGAQTLGRALAGGSAAYQGVDAYNRFKNDDYLGGTIGTLGAIGSGAALIPTPITRVGGALLGGGAELTNYLLDKYRESQQPKMAAGGLVYLAAGGQPDGEKLSTEEFLRQLRESAQKNQPTQPRTYEERLRDMGRDPSQPGSPIVKNTPPSKGASGGAGFTPGTMNPFNPDSPLNRATGGDVKKPEANEGGAFIGYPQINKNRKIGSGTGFLDALVGAPPSRENILNPSDYSYMQGYEKGEPYGIAAMALPFAGMAAKPLAKEVATRAFMGESLTPKMMRGLMPEAPAADIVAYHGTPHQFNKFDLAEIGQGEGSQAFGHGIYLAESPGVAKGYQQALSGQMVTPQDLVDYFKPGEVRRKMGGYDKVVSFHPATENKNWHTIVQEVVKNKEGDWVPHPSYGRLRAHSTTPDPIDFKQNMNRELGPAGYFYKVDVPDEHIAKMVDWDLPFKQQPQNIQDAFAKVNPIAVMQKDPSNEFTRWLRQPDTVKVLQEMDVPGIKYLDRGSRFGNQSAKTQNFVVFDPDKSTKILERNNEPIGPLSNLE